MVQDVIIIGAGVCGCAIARELAKYTLNIEVLEKDYDIANGTSKANSGIIHPGEDPIPGSLKAKMNIRGNALFDTLSEELNFPFKRNGAMVLAFKEDEREKLEELLQRGIENGVEKSTMRILTKEEIIKREPQINEDVKYALHLQTGGIVGPYEMTIALAENAACNGVKFTLDTKVEKVEKDKELFNIYTNKGVFKSRIVINAAGVFADEINNSISAIKYKIIARKGEYLLLDKKEIVQSILFQLPTKLGKGILVTPTCHGNIIVGPTAMDLEDKNNLETSKEMLDQLIEKADQTIPKQYLGDVITSFAGIRAHEIQGDFVIGEAKDVKGFINVLGIESPGLTSAPAIAEYVTQIVVEQLQPHQNEDFNPIRTHNVPFSEASYTQKKELIQQNQKYGKVVCRCEMITEAEILQAIHGLLGAKTLDGIKRRTRAGMGRCQGGFCMNRLVELLAEELEVPMEEVRKNSEGSILITGCLKEGLEEPACTN